MSKFPPAFNIDINIDDSLNIKLEGDIFGFRTILVQADEVNWKKRINKEIELIGQGS